MLTCSGGAATATRGFIYIGSAKRSDYENEAEWAMVLDMHAVAANPDRHWSEEICCLRQRSANTGIITTLGLRKILL